jgi:hypothetical protein
VHHALAANDALVDVGGDSRVAVRVADVIQIGFVSVRHVALQIGNLVKLIFANFAFIESATIPWSFEYRRVLFYLTGLTFFKL